MNIYDFCALALMFCGTIGFLVKSDLLRKVFSIIIFQLGFIFFSFRGLTNTFSSASHQLIFFFLFFSNIIFILFITTTFHLVKDFKSKEEV